MRTAFFAMLMLPAVSVAQTPARYRIDSRTTVTTESPGMQKKMGAVADQAAAMGESVDDDILGSAPKTDIQSLFALITMSTRDSGGGVLVHAVVDSVAQNLGSQGAALQRIGMAGPTTGSVKGATIDLFLVGAEITGTPVFSVAKDQRLVAIADEIESLFPAASTAKPGDIVIDSTLSDSEGPFAGTQTQVKMVSRTFRPTSDTLGVTVKTLIRSDLGSRGNNMNAVLTTVRWFGTNPLQPQGYDSNTEATTISIAPIAGTSVTRTKTVSTMTLVK